MLVISQSTIFQNWGQPGSASIVKQRKAAGSGSSSVCPAVTEQAGQLLVSPNGAMSSMVHGSAKSVSQSLLSGRQVDTIRSTDCQSKAVRFSGKRLSGHRVVSE